MEHHFFLNATATNLLFEGLDLNTWYEFTLACLLFACTSIILEILATVGTHLTRRYTANPLDMKWESSVNSRSPLLAPLQIPSSVAKVRQRRCRIHFGRSIIHLFTVVIGYLVMLVVMTYNAYFLISVVVGSAVGYLMFAPFRRRPKKKMPTNRRAKRDDLTRSGQMDTSGGSGHGTSGVNYYGSL